MMAMAADKPISKWRNFASWSAAGGVLTALAIGLATWVMRGNIFEGSFKSGSLDPRIALVLLVSAALVGLTSLNKPFGWRSFRNMAILSAVAGTIALLAISGIRPLVAAGTFGTMGASHWAATGVGLLLLLLASLTSFVLLIARRGSTLLEAEQAETLRERGRLSFLSWIVTAAMGLMLILLGLAAPGSVVSPTAALTGVLVLLVVTALLSIAVWRLMDELDRILSYESGNLAFYLIVLLGGGWATLAHLGFVAGPASLDWLTLFTVLMFAATFIAMGRRNLLTS